MSVKITLDRPALAAYIDNDPDFKLELNAAILSEIVTKFFSKDAARIIRESDRDLFDKAVSAFREDDYVQEQVREALKKAIVNRSWGSSVPALSPEIQSLIKDGQARALAGIEADLGTKALAKAQEVLPDVMATIEERIQKRVNRRVDEHISAEVDRRVNVRLAEVLNGLKSG